jgi:hypothetical protein
MFNIVAQLPAHSTAGSMEFLIFLDTVFIFEAQWLQCFLLLVQFLVQETAHQKKIHCKDYVPYQVKHHGTVGIYSGMLIVLSW